MFLEIGTDDDHVHFLVQSTPDYSPIQIVKIIKSITARKIFVERPQVKKKLWGGQFWTDGFFDVDIYNEKILKEIKNKNYLNKCEKEHNGITTREYYMSDEINWMNKKNKWKGLKSIGLARNIIEKNGKK